MGGRVAAGVSGWYELDHVRSAPGRRWRQPLGGRGLVRGRVWLVSGRGTGRGKGGGGRGRKVRAALLMTCCCMTALMFDVCLLSVCAPFFASPTALPPSPFASPATLPMIACD